MTMRLHSAPGESTVWCDASIRSAANGHWLSTRSAVELLEGRWLISADAMCRKLGIRMGALQTCIQYPPAALDLGVGSPTIPFDALVIGNLAHDHVGSPEPELFVRADHFYLFMQTIVTAPRRMLLIARHVVDIPALIGRHIALSDYLQSVPPAVLHDFYKTKTLSPNVYKRSCSGVLNAIAELSMQTV